MSNDVAIGASEAFRTTQLKMQRELPGVWEKVAADPELVRLLRVFSDRGYAAGAEHCLDVWRAARL